MRLPEAGSATHRMKERESAMMTVIENQLIICAPQGPFTIATLKEIADRLREIEADTVIGDRFYDFTLVTDIDLRLSDFIAYGKLRNIPDNYPVIRSAFYVDSLLKLGFARMCQTVLENDRSEIKVCKTMEEAAHWLGLPERMLTRQTQ